MRELFNLHSLTAVLQAQRLIARHIRPTPLVRSPTLSQIAEADVWLKLECRQPTGSFKVRGALNKIGRLSPEQKQRGIVAGSAGNHTLGVAFAAQSLGDVTADIFVPRTAPRAKVDKLRRMPVRVHTAGQTYEDAHQTAAAFAAETGALEIPAYDDVVVAAGQGTVAWEILAQAPKPMPSWFPSAAVDW